MKLWQSLAAAALLAGLSAAVMADTYTIDPVHSSAIFRIKHMGATYVYGRITGPEGKVAYDSAKPEASSFNVTLKAQNVDTANKQRDDHLRSPSFFNATDFPVLTFQSTSVKKAGDATLEVTGDLTIHGVTRSITVKLEHTGDGSIKGMPIVGFETVFGIKRSDFGMKELLGVAGDDVRLMVAFEADKK